MPRISNVVPLRAARQVTVFDGTPASEEILGIREYRVDSRDGGPSPEPWSGVERDDYYGFTAEDRVEVGAMFERQLISQVDGTETYGSWEYIGQATQVRDKYVPVNIDRDRLSAPGAPMRRPEGSDLILPDGSQPNRPASGEQDLDPLTGELLFEDELDENGDPVPVLVP